MAIALRFFDWSEFLLHHQSYEIELFELKNTLIINRFSTDQLIFKVPFTAGLRLIIVIFTILACTEIISEK